MNERLSVPLSDRLRNLSSGSGMICIPSVQVTHSRLNPQQNRVQLKHKKPYRMNSNTRTRRRYEIKTKSSSVRAMNMIDLRPLQSLINQRLRCKHDSGNRWVQVLAESTICFLLVALCCSQDIAAAQSNRWATHGMETTTTTTTKFQASSLSMNELQQNSTITSRSGGIIMNDHAIIDTKLLTFAANFHNLDRSAERTAPVCQVSAGESVAILEMEESRGSDMSQSTNPAELPISGSVALGEIELKIESETHKYFKIEDKKLRLVRPLDRDMTLKHQQPILSIYLQISCIDQRPSPRLKQPKKVIIPVLVKVLDLNDNAPKFSQQSYTVQVDELTPVNSIVLDQIQALDPDSANNGQVEYQLYDLTVTPAAAGANSRAASRPQQNDKLASAANQQHSTASASLASTSTTTTARPHEMATRNREETINLDSEPIINGPMDDSEEDESDDALLASLANSTGSEPLDPEPDGMILTLSSQLTPLQRRHQLSRRLRRGAHFRRQFLATSLDSDTQDAGAATADSTKPAAATTTRRPPTTVIVAATANATTKDQHSLWTNLMSFGGDLDAVTPSAMQKQQQQKTPLQQQQQSQHFVLELSPESQRPVIKLKRALDYELQRVHQLILVATDRATNKSERLSSSVGITVRVLDGDDQGPAFVLEQVGCATGSVHSAVAQTTSLPRATLLRSRRHSSDTHQQQQRPAHLPKGFKVTEDNFDFSDASGPLSAADSDEASTARWLPSANSQVSASALLPAADESTLSRNCLPISTMSASGQAEYFATVMSGDSSAGQLVRVAPQAIRARDRDELNAPIRYSFVNNGTPANYADFFQINPVDGSVKQVAPLSSAGRFVLWVEAQEQTARRLSSVAKLTIDVLASDKSPPVLVPNSYAGFVDENSPIGTLVLVSPFNSKNDTATKVPAAPLQISVVDPDDEKQQDGDKGASLLHHHRYEFETTSDAFKVNNNDGTVYVARWPLDRDAPHQPVHAFQVTARRVGHLSAPSARSLSPPLSLNVTLIDVNDNPPQIANSSLTPIQFEAISLLGSTASNQQSISGKRRLISVIKALDKDSGDNAKLRFSLRHVSNGGRDRFRISAESGELEALGKFQAGEQFSLTVEVIDELERSAQGILEVSVAPGANQAGPQFVADDSADGERLQTRRASSGAVVEVSEAAAPHTLVHQVRATDPEGDPIMYSIIDGNTNADFYIKNDTGHIYVAKPLDREEIGAYTLLVQARDSGGLASQRPLRIVIVDANDQNPVFERESYVFATIEGGELEPSSGRLLGRVRAHDADSGENGHVSYRLLPLGDSSGGGASGSDDALSLFTIGEQTGELRLVKPLDYERAQSHTLLVQATDHGFPEPRASSVPIVVRVLDAQDEPPYFADRLQLDVRVEENLANRRLGQVRARDPDSVPQVTYVIKQGDTSLFSVDPQTGVVSTTRAGLDYEQAKQHVLLIGTLENRELDLARAAEELDQALAQSPGTNANTNALLRLPICKVEITVVDVNDHAPQFADNPPILPVRVQSSAPLGQQVARVSARDLDASAPNNQLRYELVTNEAGDDAANATGAARQDDGDKWLLTSGRCARSFMIDAQSGAVSVRSDLRRDTKSECQLVIRARDLGEPALSSAPVTLTVFIDHVAETSASAQLGFTESEYTVELEENAAPDRLVKLLPVANKPDANAGFPPLSCEIVNGNESGKFYVVANEQRDCELHTAPIISLESRPATLDYEERQRYALKIRLNTIGSGVSSRAYVQVNVQLLDQNDNSPVFQHPARYSHLTQGKFLAAVASDAPIESQVIQVRATDADSPLTNGLVSYELANSDENSEMRESATARFKVDPVNGIVRTSRSMEDVPVARLPLRLRLLARDNPASGSLPHYSVAEIIVNPIEDRHRLALVLKDVPTSRAMDSKEELLSVIQERTGLISGFEKAESLKIQRNYSGGSQAIESDVTGTDFWFHLVEPGSYHIVASDDLRVRSSLFEPRSQASLIDIINQTLAFPRARIRLPYSLPMHGDYYSASDIGASLSRSSTTGSTTTILATTGANGRAASSLISVALVIAIISAIVIIFQCGSWSSYSRSAKEKLYLQHQQQQHAAAAALASQQYGWSTGSQLAGHPHEFRSGFSTLVNSSTSAAHLRPLGNLPKEPIYHLEQQPNGCPNIGSNQNSNNINNNNNYNNKEYETQMLKMSVLFDDCNSLDEQNCNTNRVSTNLKN